jgi:hypothetical protein
MNRRDIELLSAYLDGELKPSDLTKLETRLKSNPELASVLNDLRATRTLLRKLPTRKAPRNFTLTRQMAGQNPPLPRTYPIFRLATAVATLLFFLSFGINTFGTQMASQSMFGIGGGGGGSGGEVESYAAEAPAMESPAAPAPAEPAAPSADSALAPPITEVPPSEEAARIIETPSEKNGEGENLAGQSQPQVSEDALQSSEVQNPAPLVSSVWQIGLAIIAVVSALFMGLMRQLSARRWK